jgi:hypothetical protein
VIQPNATSAAKPSTRLAADDFFVELGSCCIGSRCFRKKLLKRERGRKPSLRFNQEPLHKTSHLLQSESILRFDWLVIERYTDLCNKQATNVLYDPAGIMHIIPCCRTLGMMWLSWRSGFARSTPSTSMARDCHTRSLPHRVVETSGHQISSGGLRPGCRRRRTLFTEIIEEDAIVRRLEDGDFRA